MNVEVHLEQENKLPIAETRVLNELRLLPKFSVLVTTVSPYIDLGRRPRDAIPLRIIVGELLETIVQRDLGHFHVSMNQKDYLDCRTS